MKLIVDERHAEAVNKELDEAQGRATERCIKDWKELLEMVEDEVNNLPCIPKVAMAGSRLYFRVGAGHYPSCYHYEPMGTCACVEMRKDGKPELIGVGRAHVRGGEYAVWRMTDRAKEAILKAMNIE